MITVSAAVLSQRFYVEKNGVGLAHTLHVARQALLGSHSCKGSPMVRSLISRLFVSALFISVAACSSQAVDDGARTGEDAITDNPICSTLDYAHARSNEDYFKLFEDDESALAYAAPFLLAVGKPPPKEISHDPRLLRLVDEAYRGFKAVFPSETRGFDTPPRIGIWTRRSQRCRVSLRSPSPSAPTTSAVGIRKSTAS